MRLRSKHHLCGPSWKICSENGKWLHNFISVASAMKNKHGIWKNEKPLLHDRRTVLKNVRLHLGTPYTPYNKLINESACIICQRCHLAIEINLLCERHNPSTVTFDKSQILIICSSNCHKMLTHCHARSFLHIGEHMWHPSWDPLYKYTDFLQKRCPIRDAQITCT